MTKNIWIISDTHFNHANFLKFKDEDGNFIRPFDSLEEMNELIIQNWNKTIKPGDKVYHLGDVFFGSKGWFEKNWPRLNGKKRLIVGNHDDIKWLSSGAFFEKVYMWRMFPEFNLLLTHVPVHESNIKIRVVKDGYQEGDVGKVVEQFINVHGHIHQNPSPKGPYFNACVEVNNYTPINIEDIKKGS